MARDRETEALLEQFRRHRAAHDPTLPMAFTPAQAPGPTVGYQLVLSRGDFSDVHTYLLPEWVRAGDDPAYVHSVSPAQLRVLADEVARSN